MEYNISQEYCQIIKNKITSMEYWQAVSSANKLLAYDKENSLGYYLRGIANYALKNFEISIDDYTCALLYNPNYAKAFYNRGVAKCQIGKFSEALEDISQAMMLFSDDNDLSAVKKCSESLEIIKNDANLWNSSL